MYKILIADGSELKVSIEWQPLDKELVEKLEKLGHEVVLAHYEAEELKIKIKEFDVIIIGESTIIDKETIDSALETNKLKLIVKAGLKLDNIDSNYAISKGIAVKNTSECGQNAIAELILGHILSISRFLFQAFTSMKNNEWNQASYTGIEISNRTLGLVGFDDTAKALAKKAQSLGMKVRYCDENGKAEGYDDFECLTFKDLLKNSTFVSLHVPYNPEKKYLIGKEEFMSMEKGANIINCSDGRLIDEVALLEALGASMAELHLFGACCNCQLKSSHYFN